MLLYLRHAPEQVRGCPKRTYGYLLKAAIQKVGQELKQRKKKNQWLDLSAAENLSYTEDKYEYSHIEACISELSPMLRQVIRMVLSGYTQKEIAELKHKKIKTINKSYERAKQELVIKLGIKKTVAKSG